MATLSDSKPRRASHFDFLALPFELRSKIIKYAIRSTHSTSELAAWQKLQQTGCRTGWEIKPEDFTISSTGLKCHSQTSLNLVFVNKQLRHEALNILFRNATVCIHLHIPRYGPFSTIPNDISKTYRILRKYSILLERARDVTLIVDSQPVHSKTVQHKLGSVLNAIFGYHRSLLWDIMLMILIVLPLAKVAQLSALISRIVPFQGKRHTDLQALVDLLVQAPARGTHMKIILYLKHLYLQDLAIVLSLVTLRCGPTTLEEAWTFWRPYNTGLRYMKEQYDEHYKTLVMSTAKQVGCSGIFDIPPEFELDETDEIDVRGTQYIGRSRRTWTENNHFDIVIE